MGTYKPLADKSVEEIEAAFRLWRERRKWAIWIITVCITVFMVFVYVKFGYKLLKKEKIEPFEEGTFGILVSSFKKNTLKFYV